MQPREKLLVGVVGALALLAGVWFVGRNVQASFTQRNGRIATLEKEVADKDQRIAAGAAASRRLDEFRQRSLPADAKLSQSLVQNWLLALVDRAKLKGGDVKPITAVASRGSFQLLRFTVRGQGTLPQMVDFLHSFYSQDYLHQAQILNLKRIEGTDQIDMTLTVEVAIVPGAPARQKLEDAPSDRLAMHSREDYRQAIVGRNVYAAYVPPRPRPLQRPEPPKPPPYDEARQAVVTAILDEGGAPQAWVSVRTSGKWLKLREGEAFSVGSLKGTVTRIGPQEIEILADGKRRLVALGKSLQEGREVGGGEG
jgi:hypothetical protein